MANINASDRTSVVQLKQWLGLNEAPGGDTGLKMGEAAVMPSKEPIAYLYNGVRLQPLPEWDKETYPYATISQGFGRKILFLWTEQPFVGVGPDSTLEGLSPKVEHTWIQYSSIGMNGDFPWEYDGTSTAPGGRYDWVLPFWSNTDIYTTDGELYLAASDPILVYE